MACCSLGTQQVGNETTLGSIIEATYLCDVECNQVNNYLYEMSSILKTVGMPNWRWHDELRVTQIQFNRTF